MLATKGKEENKRFHKGLDWKGFVFLFYGGIKYVRSGLYDREKAVNYFRFISILKLIKTILKLLDKYKKEDRNDMVADMAQRARSNIKFYDSALINI